jgi:nitrite reductase/ring-hydroxylating ferredoxin subunit
MAGDLRLLLCRIGDEIHALDAVCPHRGALLSQGELVRNAVVCPWHQWAFDVTTGEGITNPHSKLRKHTVSVRDCQIVLEKESDSGPA